MPASAMTRSLPRPRTKCGRSRVAGEADERPQLVGVVDGREQVGRPADAHRREPGERLVARRLDPDPALDVGARSRSASKARDHAAAAAARHDARCSLGVREGLARSAAARTSSATASAAPGRPSAAGRRRHRGVAPRVVEERRPRRAARRRRSASSSTSRAAPASTRLAAFARWCPAACGYGTTTIGRPSAVTSASVDDAGPADDEVGRGERGQHLVAQERVRPVAVADGSRAGPRGRPAPPRSRRRRSRG